MDKGILCGSSCWTPGYDWIILWRKTVDQKNPREGVSKKIIQPEELDKAVVLLFEMLYDADAIMNEPSSKIVKTIQISKPSPKTVFWGAFDKHSIVFISAIRFGMMVMIAAIIAFQFEFVRSYWVPLSCVAVMSGSTMVATFHRAIQRALGTILGIFIASVVLAANLSGYIIACFILLLTFITELFIVKNYGLAALFFTPNALLIAESTSQGVFSFSYFASARLIDVIIGSIIGLIGVWVVGRRSASSRLPHLITKTIRSQFQFLFILFSEQGEGFIARNSKEMRKMRTNMINLKTLYQTAAGEIPVNQRALEYYWPVIFSMEHFGYLLENSAKIDNRPVLSDESTAQLLYVGELLANSSSRETPPPIKMVPDMKGFPGIQKEIVTLQKALQMSRLLH